VVLGLCGIFGCGGVLRCFVCVVGFCCVCIPLRVWGVFCVLLFLGGLGGFPWVSGCVVFGLVSLFFVLGGWWVVGVFFFFCSFLLLSLGSSLWGICSWISEIVVAAYADLTRATSEAAWFGSPPVPS